MSDDFVHTPQALFDGLGFLRLLHLADSALPIGAMAHSFGLESLVSAETLHAGNLFEFLAGYLQEGGMLEAAGCRQAFRLARGGAPEFAFREWIELNDLLSALKPARESRDGSAALGKNFLNATLAVEELAILLEARGASQQSHSAIHHCAAFGLVGTALGFDEETVVLAYAHQTIGSLVSACQRLMPLGQTGAMRILWSLKSLMLEVVRESSRQTLDEMSCFMPLLDWGAMEHPALATRLFIS
jgi:urease accessory protein